MTSLEGPASSVKHFQVGQKLRCICYGQPACPNASKTALLLLKDSSRAADDDKLFDLQGSASFPDALSELGNLQEQPNDRQVDSVVMFSH